jgi:tRNA pseudouridine32 synthase / 23S rRNA pseudouridine746 synthase
LVVIPARNPGPCLRDELSKFLGRPVWVVHRLDKEASGVVIFALTAESHKRLCAEFESRTAKKTYLALVHGVVEADGVVDKPLKLFGSGRMGVHPDGKPSVTRYEVVERRGDKTLLFVFPETGRQHQIRVHLYSIGHPIVGDPLYGKEPVTTRLMLHASKLEIAGATIESHENFKSAPGTI